MKEEAKRSLTIPRFSVLRNTMYIGYNLGLDIKDNGCDSMKKMSSVDPDQVDQKRKYKEIFLP